MKEETEAQGKAMTGPSSHGLTVLGLGLSLLWDTRIKLLSILDLKSSQRVAKSEVRLSGSKGPPTSESVGKEKEGNSHRPLCQSLGASLESVTQEESNQDLGSLQSLQLLLEALCPPKTLEMEDPLPQMEEFKMKKRGKQW